MASTIRTSTTTITAGRRNCKPMKGIKDLFQDAKKKAAESGNKELLKKIEIQEAIYLSALTVADYVQAGRRHWIEDEKIRLDRELESINLKHSGLLKPGGIIAATDNPLGGEYIVSKRKYYEK